ncbi:GroES-like protein [Penicillium sp. IBT 18751x]|nr:GroES-like protein [Penicillium sp. IBT 18751x]
MSAHEFKVFRGTPSGDIVETVTQVPALVKDQVLISVTHSGVCGTDEHYLRSGIALGHEGAGIVKELGPDAKKLKIGDRVGWGYVNGGCGTCPSCLDGFHIRCEGPSPQVYGQGFLDSGSFATSAVRSEAFLHVIPEGLSSASAAPLMCGGITVWSALTVGGVKPSDTVGIVGVGGLGHLGIQFAKAMGCEVVVFSTTDSKKDQAMELGASHFVSTRGKSELIVPKKLNHLLVTTSQTPDWDLFMPIMAAGATIFPMTATDFEAKLTIPYMQFLVKGMRLMSAMPTTASYGLMLEFASRNGISPVIDRDELTADGIVRSMEKLRMGRTRYRGVLYGVEED